MVMCFAPDCKHYSERHLCSFFKFPKDVKEKARWTKLIRRQDRDPSDSSRICSCHFVDGIKSNGPSVFEHNKHKRLIYHSPEKPGKRVTSTQESSTPEPDQICEPQPGTSQDRSVFPITNIESKTNDEDSLAVLKAENYFLKQEVEQLRVRLSKLQVYFTFEHISDRDELIMLYTGIPNKSIYLVLFGYLERVPRVYYSGTRVEGIAAIDQLFMTLYKLKTNMPYKDIACRFNYSVATVSNVFLTWLHLIHEAVYQILMKNVPSREKNKACLPNCFSFFPNVKMILDCTEIFTEIPHSLSKQREMYSHYKHRNTAKGLVGVAPNGVITYISKLYPGSTSDKKIVRDCGVLSVFEAGDLILADKGFLIGDLLPPGVSLNIPPFLLTPQFTPEQIIKTRSIARARIHVERAIRRVKTFNILSLIPTNLIPHASKIWQTCAVLTNFHCPLIKEVEEYYRDTQ